jgi:hypothetical protein
MGVEEATQYIFKAVGYEPTDAQWEVHRDPTRHKLVTGGERAGKSRVNAMEIVKHWYLDKCIPKIEGGLYWLVGADYEGCRGDWEHLVEAFAKLGQIKSLKKAIDPAEMILGDNTTFVTKSAKYPERIATVAPDGIGGCEAAQLAYEIFLRSRSRVAEKRGFIIFTGTLEEEEYTSWYSSLYQLGQGHNHLDLKSFSIPSWSNPYVFPLGETDPELLKLKASMTHERFMERFAGVPAPKTGRVMKGFTNKLHVKECPFDKDLPVELGIDVGYGAAYAVEAVQQVAGHLHVIDEVYLEGYVTEDIITICQKRPWWDNVIGGAIDIAGTQHQGMTSPVEVWGTKGKIALVYKKVNVEDGIDLFRVQLKQDPVTLQVGIEIDPKCEGLISEMGGCESPIEGGGIWMRDKNTDVPLRKNDHGCKAIIYLLANKFLYHVKGDRLPDLRFTGEPARQTFRGR